MKIEINEPCHENWNAMQPNNDGAFCLSCQKNVVDFSKKSISEIKNYFNSISQSSNLCGRFKTSQLEELSFDDFFEKFKKWRLPYKLAVILVFTFGLGLFSCQTNSQPKTETTTIDSTINKTDSSVSIDGLVEPTTLGAPTPTVCEPNNMIVGEAIYMPPKDTLKIKKNNDKYLKGRLKGAVNVITKDSTIAPKQENEIILGKPSRK